MTDSEEKSLKIAIRCECEREISLELVGGQYQDRWNGECKCGRIWNLDEISETLAEIQD